MTQRKRVLIMGAGGRDFHVFLTCYRDDPSREVVAFTAAQIPHIDRRFFPAVLAGSLYPHGIPIVPEKGLGRLIRDEGVGEVVFAYSDVSYEFVEGVARRVEDAGARFETFDPERTMLRPSKPCIAVCAVRTGCGKSSVSRHVVAGLRDAGKHPVVVRHPMPYGDLRKQVAMRFASAADLDRHECTIEEREEYEPHLADGNVVFGGADYARVVEAAEREADILVWDGGNNDAPFLRPDLLITLVDPLRPGHELTYFPGRWNFERADVLVIAKTDEAEPEGLATVRGNIERFNPNALVVEGRSPLTLSDAAAVKGKRALVIEDGPTATHGEMGYGAGLLAAQRAGATIVDPRPFATGEIAAAFRRYPHLRRVVPAIGYGDEDLRDLAATIDKADCDVVVIGTPVDLAGVISIDKPHVQVSYRFEETRDGELAALLRERFGDAGVSAT